MKKMLAAAMALGVFALLLPIIVASTSDTAPPEPETVPPDKPAITPAVPETSAPQPIPFSVSLGDSHATLRVLDGEEIIEMTMADYLVGTVSAEMPASFEPDALAAQTTAARTYVLHNIMSAPHPRHPDADVCTDFTCCAAFLSAAQQSERWDHDFALNLNKIRRAIASTDGVYITFDDAPILAVFHSSSFGATENADAVWSDALAYLVSVPSPETADDVPNFISTVSISFDDFAATVKNSYPSAELDGATDTWLTELTTNASGRIATVKIGGVTLTGAELRALFSLRSTAAAIEIGNEVLITTAGYGHGVGMSQYGANAMAKSGANWRDILRAYYSGVAFSDEVADISL